MSQRTFGNITITFPDNAYPSEKAGTLGTEEQQEILKARDGVAHTSISTAGVMATHGDRFLVKGVSSGSLEAAGKAVDAIDGIIVNLQTALLTFKQERLLRGADAHEELLRVNRYMNSQEKDDPTLRQLTPELNDYMDRK